MGIIAKSESTGDRKLPSAGLHKAICCDVHNLGYEETQWGPKERVLFVFEIDEDHPDFEGPFRVNKRYNISLHEKATLSQDLESWRGKSFSAQERKEGFDLEKCIGVPCMVNIVHNEKDDRTYANIKAIMPLPKDQEEPDISDSYVRIKDRPDDDNSSSNGTQPKKEEEIGDNFAAEKDLDDLPF